MDSDYIVVLSERLGSSGGGVVPSSCLDVLSWRLVVLSVHHALLAGIRV